MRDFAHEDNSDIRPWVQLREVPLLLDCELSDELDAARKPAPDASIRQKRIQRRMKRVRS